MVTPRDTRSTREVLNIVIFSEPCYDFPQDPEGLKPADFHLQFGTEAQ